MTKKKGKAVSFDAMVKFFMQYYDLPTKTDIEKLGDRIDRLEMLVREVAARGAAVGHRRPGGKTRLVATAADKVYAALVTFKN